MKTLKLKSQNGQLQGRGGAYWVIESPQEFAVFVRTHQRELANSPLATYDFKDMYTALPHALIPSSLAKALEEAWVYEAELNEGYALSQLCFQMVGIGLLKLECQ